MNSLFQPMTDMYPQGAPQLPSRMPMGPQGMPQGGDMSVQQPFPQEGGAGMPTMDGPPPQDATPYYIGNPMVDKYIHMFIGAV